MRLPQIWLARCDNEFVLRVLSEIDPNILMCIARIGVGGRPTAEQCPRYGILFRDKCVRASL
jgi:hypothetical protein